MPSHKVRLLKKAGGAQTPAKSKLRAAATASTPGSGSASKGTPAASKAKFAVDDAVVVGTRVGKVRFVGKCAFAAGESTQEKPRSTTKTLSLGPTDSDAA